MRKITPDYSDKSSKTKDNTNLSELYSSIGITVNAYRELVERVAELSYWNKDYLIFFRGQTFDYKNKAGNSSFYPTIYRKDPLTENDRLYQFARLREASKILRQKLMQQDIPGWKEVNRWEVIQWSLLQHYEVTSTPLIDVTQSLRVACSFALNQNKNEYAYIYMFGLPYMNSRITHNCEHSILYVRLLGIAPSIALRPHFQEGYLVGTEGITTDYTEKTELDMNNRLIAKFIIPNQQSFWGDGFTTIPKSALYPENDRMNEICSGIKDNLEVHLQDEDVGHFLHQWNKIERTLLDYLKDMYGEYSMNLSTTMRKILEKQPDLRPLFKEVDGWRKVRNGIVHESDDVGLKMTKHELMSIDEVLNKLGAALR